MVKHSDDCIKARARYEKDLAEFNARHPNHCQKCGGWGGHYGLYDPSPAGVSLGSGYMVDFDPCECVNNSICPRCGQKSESVQEAVETGVDIKCSLCGWKEGDVGIPQEPECFCGWNEDWPNDDR
jgi:hypothetical protein